MHTHMGTRVMPCPQLQFCLWRHIRQVAKLRLALTENWGKSDIHPKHTGYIRTSLSVSEHLVPEGVMFGAAVYSYTKRFTNLPPLLRSFLHDPLIWITLYVEQYYGIMAHRIPAFDGGSGDSRSHGTRFHVHTSLCSERIASVARSRSSCERGVCPVCCSASTILAIAAACGGHRPAAQPG